MKLIKLIKDNKILIMAFRLLITLHLQKNIKIIKDFMSTEKCRLPVGWYPKGINVHTNLVVVKVLFKLPALFCFTPDAHFFYIKLTSNTWLKTFGLPKKSKMNKNFEKKKLCHLILSQSVPGSRKHLDKTLKEMQ